MNTDLSPRIKRLKDWIVETVPCRTDAHRDHFDSLAFPEIVHVYVNYASRLVVPRKRTVVFIDGFWKNLLAQENKLAILSVVNEIALGKDLNSRLSNLIKFRGYRPDRYDDSGLFTGNKFWNKDFTLNVYGLHHIHLNPMLAKRGRIHSDILVFVDFSKDVATFVMVGDHNTFFSSELEELVLRSKAQQDAFVLTGVLEAEEQDEFTTEQRVALANKGVSTIANVNGKMVISALLGSDGSSMKHTQISSQILRSLILYDSLFDDLKWVSAQFFNSNLPVPVPTVFEWWLQGTNLLMVELTSGACFKVFEGQQGYAPLKT